MKVCLRCGKSYAKLKRHLDKKNICKSTFLDISPELILKDYDKYYDEYMIYKSNIKQGEEKKWRCENCNKNYKYKNNYYRHKKHYCNNSNSIIDNDNDMNSYNIINNFGEETGFKPDEMEELIKKFSANDIISGYVKAKFIDRAENRNIYLSNKRSNIVEVYVQNEWIKESLSKIIDRLIDIASSKIKLYIDHTENKYTESKPMPESISNKYRDIKNRIHNVNVYTNIRREERVSIKCVLINGRKKILDTQESNLTF